MPSLPPCLRLRRSSNVSLFWGLVGCLICNSWIGSPSAGAQSTESSIVQEAFFLVNQGSEERARAIEILTRAAEWEAVDRVLKSIDLTKETTESLAAIASRLGPSLLIRLQANESISEQSNAVLQKSMDALRGLRESSDVLKEGISKLRRDSVDEQLAGARTLLAGGNASVAEIVQALVAQDTADPNGRLANVLNKLGGGGADALIQYSIYGSDDQRSRALTALNRLEHPLLDAVVLANVHANDASSKTWRVAASMASRRFDHLPSREASVSALQKMLRRELDQATKDRQDRSIAMGWTLGQGDMGLSVIRTFQSVLQRRDVVDVAALLTQIGDLDLNWSRTVALVDIGYRQEVDPDWGDPNQVQQVLATYPWLKDPLEMLAALEAARELDDLAATIPLLRMIQQGHVDAPQLMLLHAQPSQTVLVQLASSPLARVRFEAASAIAAIEKKHVGDSPLAYAGASLVKRTYHEMSSLSDLPIVILVETRRDIRSHLTNLLRSLGYRIQLTASVQEALRVVARGGDFRMILSKAQTADMPPIELVDRVRRLRTGSHLPIVFYMDETGATVDLSWVDSPRWDAVTDVMELPYTASGMAPIMEQIEANQLVQPLSPGDRSVFRSIGREQLSRIDG